MVVEPGQETIVGVNSFGAGGTNAHVILAASPHLQSVRCAKPTCPCVYPVRQVSASNTMRDETAGRIYPPTIHHIRGDSIHK